MLNLGRFDLDRALGCIHGDDMTMEPSNVIDLTSHFSSTSVPTVARPVRGLSLGL